MAETGGNSKQATLRYILSTYGEDLKGTQLPESISLAPKFHMDGYTPTTGEYTVPAVTERTDLPAIFPNGDNQDGQQPI